MHPPKNQLWPYTAGTQGRQRFFILVSNNDHTRNWRFNKFVVFLQSPDSTKTCYLLSKLPTLAPGAREIDYVTIFYTISFGFSNC